MIYTTVNKNDIAIGRLNSIPDSKKDDFIKSHTYFKGEFQMYLDSQQCCLCGRGFAGCDNTKRRRSKEHIIPAAVLKWVKVDTTKAMMVQTFGDNLFFSHMSCNRKKLSELPTEKFIDRLYLSNQFKVRAKTLLKIMEPELTEYKELCSRISARQGGRCARCSAPNPDIIRRRDHDGPRSEDNAMLVCHTCNWDVADERRFQEGPRRRRKNYWR